MITRIHNQLSKVCKSDNRGFDKIKKRVVNTQFQISRVKTLQSERTVNGSNSKVSMSRERVTMEERQKLHSFLQNDTRIQQLNLDGKISTGIQYDYFIKERQYNSYDLERRSY